MILPDIAETVKIVNEAIAAERERCAKIVDDLDEDGICRYTEPQKLAERIRSGE